MRYKDITKSKAFQRGNITAISKDKLSRYAHKKLKNKEASQKETLVILNALIEELRDLIVSGEEINIRNFMKMRLETIHMKERFDIRINRTHPPTTYKRIRAKLSHTFKKFINYHLDNDAMFDTYFKLKENFEK